MGGEWIPVSERMPDHHRAVVVTWISEIYDEVYDEDSGVPHISIAFRHYDTWYWWSPQIYSPSYGWGDLHLAEFIKIIAWMPLPTPYKGKES